MNNLRISLGLIIAINCISLHACSSTSMQISELDMFSARGGATSDNEPLKNNEIPDLKINANYSDYAIMGIDKPVHAQWHPNGVSIMIIPLDDDENWILEDYINLQFDGPPNFDTYAKDGINAGYVEEFIDMINDKKANGIILNNYIIKDLIIYLEFSNGSIVTFDRLYKEYVKYAGE